MNKTKPISKRTTAYLIFLLAVVVISCIARYCYNWEEFSLVYNFLTNKRNFFNVYFVKYGWAWTCVVLLIPVILLENSVRNCFTATIRVIIATALWKGNVNFFLYIQQITGSCSNPVIKDIYSCIKSKHDWDGLDISGHCFILIFSLLVIWEESDHHFYIPFLPLIVKKVKKSDDKTIRTDNGHPLVVIEAIKCFKLIIRSMWVFQLITTCMFFHTMTSKVLGTMFGFLGYYFYVTICRAFTVHRKGPSTVAAA